jgi:2-dehydro-3-deoxygluconokinase
MAIVTTFGEVMLRLKTPGFSRFVQATALEATFGGGEANVAVSLAQLGHVSRWVSVVPSNAIGNWALAELRKLGVDVSHVSRRGDRLGIYFLEAGASQRASQVVYDRGRSSMSVLKPGDLSWQGALEGAKWFHTTGITPALSDGAAAATLEALAAAKARGCTTSVDLNYRRKLWSPERAGEVMAQVVAYTDVLVASEHDCEVVFGIRPRTPEPKSGKVVRERYLEVASQVLERFPGVWCIAFALGESHSASKTGWSALLADRQGHAFSRSYEISIVDRVGASDSFVAGLVHALLVGRDQRAAVEFAAAASALKHSFPGDANLATLEEIEQLAAGDASGRVQR